MLLSGVAEGLSTTGGIAATFAELGLYGLPLDEPMRFIAALERATRRRSARLAARYVDPEAACIVIVGDRAAIEPGLRALGLPAPGHLRPRRGPSGRPLGRPLRSVDRSARFHFGGGGGRGAPRPTHLKGWNRRAEQQSRPTQLRPRSSPAPPHVRSTSAPLESRSQTDERSVTRAFRP